MAIPTLPPYSIPLEVPTSRVNWQPDPKRAVLLIHDMQDYFVKFYGDNSPLMESVIQNLVCVRQWCKQQGIPVLYTAQPTEQSAVDRGLLNDMWGPGLTAADPKLQQVVAALAPDADDTILVKWRYSAFQRSDLQALLKNWGRDQLIIGGVYAQIGCLVTAMDAFMNDIQPFMINDAVAAFSEADHQMAVQYVAAYCGSVVNTAQLIGAAQSLNQDWLKARVLHWIDEDESHFDANENLMHYGLDSIQVMALVAELKKLGVQVSFEELARTPTLNAWWTLIESKSQPQ
ncbi:bifunctional isochorismate lyase/aryl carrier protein [Azomonas agilis]|uniref:isochorismatase n=1 Tax=Azomonas agilis TaxID=116849 RepID=A0A562IYL5_9GAMM|nr:isochorismatase family protein [Azomonas agilis]TWH75953.1 bifunctional isochorismate lyase/aryl carrier protein [Azomonas agilis]